MRVCAHRLQVLRFLTLSDPRVHVLRLCAENALLEDDDNTFHLVRPTEEMDEVKSKRGSMKDKAMTKAITELYLTRLLSVKVLPFRLYVPRNSEPRVSHGLYVFPGHAAAVCG